MDSNKAERNQHSFQVGDRVVFSKHSRGKHLTPGRVKHIDQMHKDSVGVLWGYDSGPAHYYEPKELVLVSSPEAKQHTFQIGNRVKIGDLKAVAGRPHINRLLRGSVTGVEVKGTRIRVVWDGDPENTWSYRNTDLVHCNNALVFTKPSKAKKPDLDDRWSQDQALHKWKQKQQNKRGAVTLAHCILSPEKEMLEGTAAQWKKWNSRWERWAKRLARKVIKEDRDMRKDWCR